MSAKPTGRHLPDRLAGRPLVVFVSEIEPIDFGASSAVIYRHLRSLERHGYDICVVTPDRPAQDSRLPEGWLKVRLPSRRFYYPPYRPTGSLRLARWLLLDQIVGPILKGRDIQCVIGLLTGEYLVGYAEWLSRSYKKPLFYFYHDRGESLHHADNPRTASRLKRQNLRLLASPHLHRVWTVSPELTYPQADLSAKFSVVYPLAEPLATTSQPRWSADWRTAPVLVHIGTVYSEALATFRSIVSGLRSVGGRLLLFSQYADTAEILQRESPDVVEFRGFAPDTKAFLETLAEEATAFLVVYPDTIEAMPWSRECFPSKFTQMVQTGMPGLIFAPPETAIGRWCADSGWWLYRPSADTATVVSALQEIACQSGWDRAALQTRTVAEGVFNPAKTEAQVNRDVASVS